MIAEDEIAAQAARIIRELPEHPAPRRFCFAGWDLHDYQRLEARIGRAGIPAYRRILPDKFNPCRAAGACLCPANSMRGGHESGPRRPLSQLLGEGCLARKACSLPLSQLWERGRG